MFRSLIFVFFQIFIFQLNFAFAQSKTEVIGEGTCTGNKSQTIESVEKKALEKAKLDALSKAGIKEHVKSTSSIYSKTETNSTADSENISFNKRFTSSFFSEKQGAVTEHEIIDDKYSYNEDGLPIYYVKIRATVIKYEKDPDYNFKAIVEGLDPVYTYDEDHTRDVKDPKDGCAVRFNFINTKDSYLTIFVTWDDSVDLVFPDNTNYEYQYNGRNSSFKFNKKEKHFFGEQPDYWFTSADKKSTDYRLIFVFHKEERSFIEDPNTDNMWKWIFEIPRDLRYIDIEYFTVHNKIR